MRVFGDLTQFVGHLDFSRSTQHAGALPAGLVIQGRVFVRGGLGGADRGMPLRALGVFEAAERVLGLGVCGGIIGRSEMAAGLAQRLGGIGPRFGGACGRLFAAPGERFVAATQFLHGGRCRILPAGYQQSHGAAALAMIGAADDDAQIGGSFQFNYRKMHAMPRHVIPEVAPRTTLLEHHVNVDVRPRATRRDTFLAQAIASGSGVCRRRVATLCHTSGQGRHGVRGRSRRERAARGRTS